MDEDRTKFGEQGEWKRKDILTTYLQFLKVGLDFINDDENKKRPPQLEIMVCGRDDMLSTTRTSLTTHLMLTVCFRTCRRNRIKSDTM
jgi:hypothetical protein